MWEKVTEIKLSILWYDLSYGMDRYDFKIRKGSRFKPAELI